MMRSSLSHLLARHPGLIAWSSSIALHTVILSTVLVVGMVSSPWNSLLVSTDGIAQIPMVIDDAGHSAGDTFPSVTSSLDRQGRSLKAMIESAIANEQGTAMEVVFPKLQDMAQRLQGISSDANVRAVGRVIRSVFDDASSAKRNVDMRFGFDFATAQFHRIYQAESGIFHAVLVDQFGNPYETVIDEATAVRVQRLLMLLDEFPLLRTVYEEVVCGILNQVNVATSPAPQA